MDLEVDLALVEPGAFEPRLPLVGEALPVVRPPLAVVRHVLAAFGQGVTPVLPGLALVGRARALAGRAIPLVGEVVTPVEPPAQGLESLLDEPGLRLARLRVDLALLLGDLRLAPRRLMFGHVAIVHPPAPPLTGPAATARGS